MHSIVDLRHPHIIERFAVIDMGDQVSGFLFLQPDGGNLQDLWTATRQPALSGDLVKEVLVQLRGLADALCLLHEDDRTGNWIHADLKPENIVRFTDSASTIGTLQIADLGYDREAKWEKTSSMRRSSTATSYNDSTYESPEAFLAETFPRTRLSEIWSMGCVIFEFILWMLFGSDGLERFRRELAEGSYPRFFEIEMDISRQIRINKVVMRWMSCMSRDPECQGDTSLADLLRLVKEQLLIPIVRESSFPQGRRANSAALRKAIDEILYRARMDDKYFCTGSRQLTVRHLRPHTGEASLAPLSMYSKRVLRMTETDLSKRLGVTISLEPPQVESQVRPFL